MISDPGLTPCVAELGSPAAHALDLLLPGTATDGTGAATGVSTSRSRRRRAGTTKHDFPAEVK